MVYTLQLPLEVSKRPLKYLPQGVTFYRGDRLDVILAFFDEIGNRIVPEGFITLTGFDGETTVFRIDDFNSEFKGSLNLNTVELLDSTAGSVKVVVRFIHEDKQRTISFNATIKEKHVTGPDPTTVPAFYPNPEDVATKDFVREARVVIQEKRVSQINFNEGYIELEHDPEDVVSVVVAGGVAQYGSYDPDEPSFESDYYIDRNFIPPRLVWKRTWSDSKEFALSKVIAKGDKIIISYNKLMS